MIRKGLMLLAVGVLLVLPARFAADGPDPSVRPSSSLTLTYPGTGWSLVVDLPGFQVSAPRTKADGTGIAVRGENPESGSLVSIFLEKAAHEGGAKACRDFYWKEGNQGPVRVTKVKQYERGEMALVEYMIPKFQGVHLGQKHLNAYLAHDGIWIDIHLSKVGFLPEDQRLFDGILDSVRFDATPPVDEGAATRP